MNKQENYQCKSSSSGSSMSVSSGRSCSSDPRYNSNDCEPSFGESVGTSRSSAFGSGSGRLGCVSSGTSLSPCTPCCCCRCRLANCRGVSNIPRCCYSDHSIGSSGDSCRSTCSETYGTSWGNSGVTSSISNSHDYSSTMSGTSSGHSSSEHSGMTSGTSVSSSEASHSGYGVSTSTSKSASVPSDMTQSIS